MPWASPAVKPWIASIIRSENTHSKEFEQIKNQIYDLIKHRSKIISGTLPVDELKRITKQVTSEIDMGNKILGLDMIVRNKDGTLINPDETIAVKNFTCKMNEDAELLMTLYDAKENRAITENYVVRWSKDGLMSDLDQMYTLRVMFTLRIMSELAWWR
ncbi:hypothetical protein ILUMI_10483 [Ignelater luminosus]|uniref:Dedicator of cytokinesis N-terminal domain-containing protein n=1 Tax=Ignelater luminosus TaxID=2038154 RepID=A0A8K0CXU1_IGNLU|nr:hypothetical protein ILUMI_10483 [Ignelater luminosus]